MKNNQLTLIMLFLFHPPTLTMEQVYKKVTVEFPFGPAWYSGSGEDEEQGSGNNNSPFSTNNSPIAQWAALEHAEESSQQMKDLDQIRKSTILSNTVLIQQEENKQNYFVDSLYTHAEIKPVPNDYFITLKKKAHPLIAAVNKQDITKVNELLAQGTNQLEYRNEQGLTALTCAIFLSNYALVVCLVEAGASIECRDKANPLLIACLMERKTHDKIGEESRNIIKYLLKKGAYNHQYDGEPRSICNAWACECNMCFQEWLRDNEIHAHLRLRMYRLFPEPPAFGKPWTPPERALVRNPAQELIRIMIPSRRKVSESDSRAIEHMFNPWHGL